MDVKIHARFMYSLEKQLYEIIVLIFKICGCGLRAASQEKTKGESTNESPLLPASQVCSLGASAEQLVCHVTVGSNLLQTQVKNEKVTSIEPDGYFRGSVGSLENCGE